MGMNGFPNRQAIDRADTLEFSERTPETTITIRAQLDGWPVDVAYRGKLDQLSAAIARLQSAGLTPAGQPASTPAAPKTKRQAIEPLHIQGRPCCPKHTKPLMQGQYGLYCSAKDDGPESKNGYCGLKFAE